jgi:thymidylate synthase
VCKKVLAEGGDRAGGVARFEFPSMPADTGWSDITTVLEHEELLRTNQAQYTPSGIASLGLPQYWQQVLLMFEAHRQIVHRTADPVDRRVLHAVDPGLRWLLENRWPKRMPLSTSAHR